MKSSRNFFLFVVFCLSSFFVYASDPSSASATSSRSKKTLEYYNLEKNSQDKEAQQRAAKQPVEGEQSVVTESALPKGEKKIFVTRITISKSQLLSNDSLAVLAQSYQGRELSFAQLNELVEKVNVMYKQAGQLTAKAYLPAQKISKGEIEIRLVEGLVGAVVLEGNRYTRGAFILNQLSLQKGQVADLKKLERELFLFNRKNDIALKAVLRPGEAPATTDYLLKTYEPPRVETLLYMDNAGRDETGKERYGAVVTARSLLGIRDVLTLGGLLTDGTQNGFLSYNMPLTKWGTRLGGSYDQSYTQVRFGNMKSLHVTGKSRDIGISLTQPILVEAQYGLNLFSGYNAKTSSTAYDKFTVLASKTRDISYGVDYSSFGDKLSWEMRNCFVNGTKSFKGDSEFFKYNNTLNAFYRLSDVASLMLRTNMQYSDTSFIPSSEQFQVGGVATVRGYPEGHLMGDNGYFASLEYSHQLFSLEKVRAVAFVDHGGIMKQKSTNVTPAANDSITSVGFGFNVTLNKYLSGRTYCGFPLSKQGVQDNHRPAISFDVQLKF
jgi:hemolysin activation/secretion protein